MRKVLPILFNTEMVRAILDGRKAVTRRICKDGNVYTVPDMSFYNSDKRTYAIHSYADLKHNDKLSIAECTCRICPGDILYVRETYCPNYFDENIAAYRGDGLKGNRNAYKADYHKDVVGDVVPEPKWIPSIHMPRKAARIWLKVTDVRVERLQDITEEQAKKEGFSCKDEFIQTFLNMYPECTEESWLWVIEFERCEKPESGA